MHLCCLNLHFLLLVRCIALVSSAAHQSSALSYFRSYNYVNSIETQYLCNTGPQVIEIFALPDRKLGISIVLGFRSNPIQL